VATEASDLGDDQEESQVEALSRDLERLAINPDSTLYQLSSSKEETQSTTDDSISQATSAQHPGPANNTGQAKSLHCNVSSMSAVLGMSALL